MWLAEGWEAAGHPWFSAASESALAQYCLKIIQLFFHRVSLDHGMELRALAGPTVSTLWVLHQNIFHIGGLDLWHRLGRSLNMPNG